jgi:hypothetical protein
MKPKPKRSRVFHDLKLILAFHRISLSPSAKGNKCTVKRLSTADEEKASDLPEHHC